MAQALRRLWLMTADDPHRLRGVLPDEVRWLHFWARYDPVACGPLSARSLPRAEPWPDPAVPDPQDALCARLDRCENIDIVNTDSTFTDHITYYQNLEQVVGPVAVELVAGHPDLERLVQAHLATADDVLRRRWRVAWRSTVAILGGLGAGTALLLWDWLGNRPSFNFGRWLSNPLPAWALTQIINTPAGWLLDLMKLVAQAMGHVGLGVGGLPTSWAPVTYSALAALTLAGLGILGIGQLLVGPPALAFERPIARPDAGNARAIIALSTLSLGLLALSSLVLASYHHDCNGPCYTAGLSPSAYVLGFLSSAASFVWILNLGFAVGIAAVGLTMVSIARHHHRGWYVPVLLLLVPLLAVGILNLPPDIVPGAGFRFLSQDAAAVGMVGCVIVAAGAIRRFEWGRAVGILLAAVLLLVSIWQQGVIAFPLPGIATYANLVATLYQGLFWASPAIVALIYGLWISRGGSVGAPRLRQSLLWTWAAVLVVLIVVALLSSVAIAFWLRHHLARSTDVLGAMLWGVAGLVASAFVISLVVSIHERQWVPAAVMVSYLVFQEGYLSQSDFVTNWQLAFQNALLYPVLATGLSYALWIRWGRSKPVQQPTAPREAVSATRGGPITVHRR